jgi:uncharacterized membrane protein
VKLPADPPQTSTPDSEPGPETEQVNQNIEAVKNFYVREEREISLSQRFVERISDFAGRPIFLGLILGFVGLWVLVNVELKHSGFGAFDPPPFSLLQGLLGLGALLTATVVLSKQNRAARLAERREHLDLKVTLLTEQKAAKLINLLEELRRDLPNVKDRHDPEAHALQKAMNPDRVLAALDENKDPEAQRRR